MGIELNYIEGQTPLDDDEKEGLINKAVATRQELDAFEQFNIQKAMLWLVGKKFTAKQILTEKFVMGLHKRMFGEVWRWAGTFRNTNKNIGIDKYLISLELRVLLDDCNYWIDNQTFPPDEIAIRFKHRIVVIHCFANGNGRHSRLIADVIIEKLLGGEVFSWSGNNLISAGEARRFYLKALRNADRNNFSDLIFFARS